MGKGVVLPTFPNNSIGDHAQRPPIPISDHVQLFRDHDQLRPRRIPCATVNTFITSHRVLQNKLTVAHQEVNHTLSPNV